MHNYSTTNIIKNNLLYIVGVLFLLFISSLRFAYKFAPLPLLSLLVFFICLYFVLQAVTRETAVTNILKKILQSGFLPYLFIIVFLMVTVFLYPLIDARKTMGLGSTGDDAIIQPALKFLSTGKLYDAKLYDGVPISPGPGWILLNSLFPILNIYWLFAPLYIFASLFICKKFYKSNFVINLTLVLISSSFLFWELLANGHDLVPLGFAFVILTFLIHRFFVEDNSHLTYKIVISILAGLISTSRIVFIALPFLFLLFIWKFNKKNALLFGLISICTNILVQLYFYLVNDFYQPLHLFARGNNNVGPALIITGIILTIILLIYSYRKIDRNIESWLLYIFSCLALPLIMIAFGELIHIDFSFRLWEGVNNLMPVIPGLCFYISLKINNRYPASL